MLLLICAWTWQRQQTSYVEFCERMGTADVLKWSIQCVKCKGYQYHDFSRLPLCILCHFVRHILWGNCKWLLRNFSFCEIFWWKYFIQNVRMLLDGLVWMIFGMGLGCSWGDLDWKFFSICRCFLTQLTLYSLVHD
jgi:hypothetical protein